MNLKVGSFTLLTYFQDLIKEDYIWTGKSNKTLFLKDYKN